MELVKIFIEMIIYIIGIVFVLMCVGFAVAILEEIKKYLSHKEGGE